MAEESLAEKSEPATEKKQKEARKQGQVARSAEVNSVAVLLAGGLMTLASVAWMSQSLRRLGVHFFEGIDTIRIDSQDSALALVELLFSEVSTLMAPVLVTVFVVGTGAAFMQVGWNFSPAAMQWRWEKFNPIEGSKKFVNKRAAFDLIKNLVKVAILVLVSWQAIEGMMPAILNLTLAVDPSWQQVGALIRDLLLRLMVVLAILAVIDFFWQRNRHNDSIKMTRAEVKQEAKDADGDPQLKARVRSIQLDMARRRMMDDVKTADVVITNPTHFAVAIKYDQSDPAPRVVAKGQGHLALRIRETALAAGVPRVENPPLARALYQAAKVGQLIPTKLYEAVAKVLAAVMRPRAAAAGAGA